MSLESLMNDAHPAHITWEHDWDEAVARAQRERKLLLIDVEKDN